MTSARRFPSKASDTKASRPPPEIVVAKRRYFWTPPGGARTPVDVEISMPKRSGRDWSSRLRITGLPRHRNLDREVFGIDAVQALEMALFGAGRILSQSPEFRAGQIEWLGGPIRHAADIGLPIPTHSIQGALSLLRAFLESKPKPGLMEEHTWNEWRRGTLGMMREIALDLATLAVRVSAKAKQPRRRPFPP